MKFNLKFLRRRWFWTILGGIFILISTYEIGFVAFKKEESLSKEKNKLNEVITKINNSQSTYDYSIMRSEIAYLQWGLVKFSIFQYKEIQDNFRNVFTTSYYPILLTQYESAGYVVDTKLSDILREQCNAAGKGDTTAMNQLNEKSAQLFIESAKYRGHLYVKRADIQIVIEELENEITKSKYISLIFQILGLAFLLVKEFPEKNKSSRDSVK